MFYLDINVPGLGSLVIDDMELSPVRTLSLDTGGGEVVLSVCGLRFMLTLARREKDDHESLSKAVIEALASHHRAPAPVGWRIPRATTELLTAHRNLERAAFRPGRAGQNGDVRIIGKSRVS